MKKKISQRALDALEVGETIWDTEQIGFGARARKGGVFFVFKVQRRGRPEWVPLGRLGDVTLDAARQLAAAERAVVVAGGRPGAWRRVPTLEEFVPRYLAEISSDQTRERAERQFRLHLFPALGKRRLDEIDVQDLARLKDRMQRRGKPAAWNNARQILSHVLNLAMKWGALPHRRNPCTDVRPVKLDRHERFLSEQELARLGAALVKFEAEGVQDPPKGMPRVDQPTAVLIAAAVRLLVFLGARRDEVRLLRWSQVGPRGLALRESKTGRKSIALNPPAAQVLEQLRALGRGGDLVFESYTRPGTPIQLNKGWLAVRRLAKLEDVRLHDLRHSFASVAVSSGQSLYLTGALLGHRSSSTTERYAHLSAEPLEAASTAVAKRIESALNAGAGETKKTG